jgi:hypothetical protein
LAACERWKLLPGQLVRMLLLAVCVSVSLRLLRENMGQYKSEAKILREIKENMGQCESKERDFKE